MSLWHLFIVNFEHILNIFVPFSNVSIDAFQQVNVCWAEAYSKLSQAFLSALPIVFNSFMTKVSIKWKPVHGFEEQINGLVSICIVFSPLGSGGGMIFVSSARQGGQLLKFKSQGGNTFRWGGDDFRQSSRGEGGTALS